MNKNYLCSYFSANVVKLILTAVFAVTAFTGYAQCPGNPAGDQVTYGVDKWIGYVYSNGWEGSAATVTAPVPENTFYIGYIEQDEDFDTNLGSAGISGPHICGSPADGFSVRYKMKKTLAPGYYEFTVGGDDGYRLSVDGGNTFITSAGRWSGHGFVSETAMQYLSGDVYFVLEYFESVGDARLAFQADLVSCTAVAPTAVTNNVIYSCNSSTIVHVEGSLESHTYYEWGSGSVVGENHLGGVSSNFFQINNVGTYWVRKTFQSPCVGSTAGYVFEVTSGTLPPGDVNVYGDNIWNVYAYDGNNDDLSLNTYKGYFTDANLSFNSENHFDMWSTTPSYSYSWQGCPMNNNNYFSYIAKRQGFDCGEYKIEALNWDDAIWVYLDSDGAGPGPEVLLYYNNTYSGGAGVPLPVNIGTYFLSENSRLILRTREDTGGATLNVRITPLSKAPESISGTHVICLGDQITLTAVGGILGSTGVYQWGSGAVSNENIIAGANTSQLTVTPAADTTYWVKIDFPGQCSTEAVTLPVTVDHTIPGVLSTPQATICKYEKIKDIAVQGYNGDILQWEMADDAGFTTNVATIAVTNDVLTATDIAPITSSKYFRATVKDGICTAQFTPAFLITVTPSVVYNGSWSGMPDITTTLEVESDLLISSPVEVCSCYVKNNATVTIAGGTGLTVKGKVSVEEGSGLVVEDNASLRQINDVDNEGAIQVHRFGSQLFKLDYTLWSAPVTGQDLYAFSPATLTNRFYVYGYNGSQEAYITVTPALNNNSMDFQEGKGYLIRMPNTLPDEDPNVANYNGGTFSYKYHGLFTGVPNNGDVSVALATFANRYNAVGNPYPSPVNVHDFFNGNVGNIEPGSALYFWRKKNNAEATSYATLTMDTYVFNDGGAAEDEGYPYGGLQWDELFNGASVNENQWLINVGQGFFVRSDMNNPNPVLKFTNSMRRSDIHNGQFFRNGQVTEKSRLWLNMKGTNGGMSQTALVYSSTATLGIDYGRDGAALNGGLVSFYSLADDKQLAVQARPSFDYDDVVPMGYKVDNAGNYIISLHRHDGVFATGQNVYIKDKLLNITHNIKEGAYTFSSEAGTFNGRFEVIYTSTALGVDNPVIINNAVIYKEGNHVKIDASQDIKSVAVYDLTGRLIYSRQGIDTAEFTSDAINVAQQVLIVKAVLFDQSQVSKKIIMY